MKNAIKSRESPSKEAPKVAFIPTMRKLMPCFLNNSISTYTSSVITSAFKIRPSSQIGVSVFNRRSGGAATCWCDSPASSFKRNTSLILRIVILGTGTLSPDKKLEAYSFGCSMRNTISMKYDAIPVS
ncbi:MAG: hypothetical protein ACYCSZ_01560 [Burkholderiales bacterium]